MTAVHSPPNIEIYHTAALGDYFWWAFLLQCILESAQGAYVFTFRSIWTFLHFMVGKKTYFKNNRLPFFILWR